MKYLLDTNVVSEFQRPRPDANVLDWMAQQNEDELCISVITLAEIRRGIALMPDGKRRSQFEIWLSDDLPERFYGRVIEITLPVADQWGILMTVAKQTGIGLDPMDGFMAATARTLGLVLATRNVKDFQSLDVPLINPWQQAQPINPHETKGRT